MASIAFLLPCSFLIRVDSSRAWVSLAVRSLALVDEGLMAFNRAVAELANVDSMTDFEDGPPDLESKSISSELSRHSPMIGCTAVWTCGYMSVLLR